MPIDPKELQAPYIDFKYCLTLSWGLNFNLKKSTILQITSWNHPFFEDWFNIIKNKINTYLFNCFESFIESNNTPDLNDNQLENPFLTLKEGVINNIKQKIADKARNETVLVEQNYVENQLFCLIDQSIS